VALVHEHEVVGVRRDGAEKRRAVSVGDGERLVGGEVERAAFGERRTAKPGAGVAEGLEVFGVRVGDEEVAVGEKEDARLAVGAAPGPAGLPRRQQSWKATSVLPVPVASVSSTRGAPCAMRRSASRTAASW
jgi:hypothetical protein